jgi:hypothetical protein
MDSSVRAPGRQKTSVMQGLRGTAALGNRVPAVHDSAATNRTRHQQIAVPTPFFVQHR